MTTCPFDNVPDLGLAILGTGGQKPAIAAEADTVNV
jgi:hypothetical protein